MTLSTLYPRPYLTIWLSTFYPTPVLFAHGRVIFNTF
nr:MAG TPA: hypothetical protein [Caudoviricetes sp.]